MTHDELIEAAARVLDRTLAFEIESDVRANEMTHEERCKIARAAIRVIAPVVERETLERAAQVCASKVGNHWDRVETLDAIRALKPRYEA